jgi:hypothetical protein
LEISINAPAGAYSRKPEDAILSVDEFCRNCLSTSAAGFSFEQNWACGLGWIMQCQQEVLIMVE